jgi:hypothetical protein
MDLSKLSDADLMALKANDLSKMSDEGLMALKGGQSVAPQTQSAEMPVSESNFAETGGGADWPEVHHEGRCRCELREQENRRALQNQDQMKPLFVVVPRMGVRIWQLRE